MLEQIRNRFSSCFISAAKVAAVIIPMILTGFITGIHSANAFPEMVRHGYVNCTTCHVSPSGGGIMTEYGRSLSKEILSTWSREKEEGVLHGLVQQEKLPEWLKLGGDVRAVQTYKENEVVKEGRFIWMQADIAAAVNFGRFTAVGSFGRREYPSGVSAGSNYYWGLYQATDEVAVRAGRFYANYGLNTMEHQTNVRSRLGFNPYAETENIEASYIGEKWNAFVTAIKAAGEVPEASREKAVSSQVTYSLWDRFKIGGSVWSGSSDSSSREMAGAHGILAFTHKLYLLTESDLQWRRNKSSNAYTRGFFNYQKLGYEIHQGVHLLGLYEYSQSNLNDGSTISEAYGTGVQWFPRPHFEFQSIFQKARTRSAGTAFDNVGYLLAHYYF